MEDLLVTAVGYLKLAVEAVGAAVVGFGALSTAAIYVLSLFGIRKRSNSEIRLFLGRYLVLGLEFQLGADILGTAVSPTFEEVQLSAAIVVIRTVLNYFLVPNPPIWQLLTRYWRMPSEQRATPLPRPTGRQRPPAARLRSVGSERPARRNPAGQRWWPWRRCVRRC